MGSRVEAVLVAALCISSLILAVPLLQSGPTGPEGPVDGDPGGEVESTIGGESGVDVSGENVSELLPESERDRLEKETNRSIGGGGQDGSGDGEQDGDGDAEQDGSGDGGQDGDGDAEQDGSGDGVYGQPGELRYGPVKAPYWRQASYDKYTGDAWVRTEDSRTYTPPSNEGTDGRTTYEIRAETALEAIPSPYEPAAVSGIDPDRIAVRGDGSFASLSPIEQGTTVTVTSRDPTWTVEELRASQWVTDESLLERYGTAREGTPNRVHERTAEITADAETPYGTAILVERWLKTQRSYSLEVPPPGDDVVDQFLFEMESGYCQYFAAAMTEMLRTQGVPARYVVGYAPSGSADGTETVTQDSAHAWVEVYFEGSGWVKFDPTAPLSAGDDTENGRQAAVSDSNPSFRAIQNDSDWEVADATVEIQSEPIPGTEGTVRVTDGGSPLVDHRVSFNGDVVGLTDERGEVTGLLPYEPALNVTVERYVGEGEPKSEDEPAQNEDESDDNESDSESDDNESDSESDDNQNDGESDDNESDSESDGSQTDGESDSSRDGSGGAGGNTIGSPAASSTSPMGGTIDSMPTDPVFTVRRVDETDATSRDRVSSPRTATDDAFARVPAEPQSRENTEIPLNNDITVEITGESANAIDLHPGGNATVTATIAGTPVPDATVTVGDRTYTTDASGTAVIGVPYTETAVVEVSRGAATGSATASVGTDATVSFREAPRPGEPVTVEVTVGGDPVAGVGLFIDATRRAETGSNGTAVITPGYVESLRVVATRGAVAGNATATLPTAISTRVDGVPIPGRGVPVVATLDGNPVANATVQSIAGNATTGANGTAVAAVPLVPQASLSVTVRRGDALGSTTVPLARAWGALGAIVLLSAAAIGYRFDVRGNARRGAAVTRGVVATGHRLPRRVVGAIVRAAQSGAETLARGGHGIAARAWAVVVRVVGLGVRAASAASAVGRRMIERVVSGVRRVPDRVRAAGSWCAVGPGVWIGRLRTALERLLAVFVGSGVAAGGASRTGRNGGRSGAAGAAGAESGADEEETIDPRVVVVRAWRRLVSLVNPRSSVTPGEIASRAVELGLPERHVVRIRDAFRGARYGEAEPSVSDAQAVSESEQAIETDRGDD